MNIFSSQNGNVLVWTNNLTVSQFQYGEVKYPTLDLKVLDTDYTNYVVWHVCDTSSPNSPYEKVATATRSLTVNAKYVALMNQIIANQIGIDPNLMQPLPRTLCQYM